MQIAWTATNTQWELQMRANWQVSQQGRLWQAIASLTHKAPNRLHLVAGHMNSCRLPNQLQIISRSLSTYVQKPCLKGPQKWDKLNLNPQHVWLVTFKSHHFSNLIGQNYLGWLGPTNIPHHPFCSHFVSRRGGMRTRLQHVQMDSQKWGESYHQQ